MRAFRYLNDGGLKNSSNHTFENNNLEYDEQLVSPLKLFQRNYHLNVIGKLDPEIVKLISTPRCGVPDEINSQDSTSVIGQHIHGGVHMTYYYTLLCGNLKWPPIKHYLTCKFNDGAQSQDGPYALTMACVQAFGLWAKVSKFTFQEVRPTSMADTLISF